MTISVTPIPRVVPFGIPALSLTTANAAGTSATAIASDASLLAFDATAPTTQDFGDSAAVGSATVSSHRDHLHGLSVIELADYTTSRLDASTSVGGNTTVNVNIQVATNSDRIYFYDAHIAVNDRAIALGSTIAADETVSPQISSYIVRSGQGSTQDYLSLINGTATERSITYLVLEAD